MNLKLIAVLTAVSMVFIVAAYMLGYHRAWDAGRADLVVQQKQKAAVWLEKQQAQQKKDDTRAAAVDTKGAARTVTITQEVVKYVRTPGRNVCTFDAARVKLKQAAVDNANSIEGYDHE